MRVRASAYNMPGITQSGCVRRIALASQLACRLGAICQRAGRGAVILLQRCFLGRGLRGGTPALKPTRLHACGD